MVYDRDKVNLYIIKKKKKEKQVCERIKADWFFTE